MRIVASTAVLVSLLSTASPAQLVTPRAGLVLTKSATLKPGTYDIASAAIDSAAIVIRGNDISLDLTGVFLRGVPESADPDQSKGLAILIDSGSNITIRNAHIRGYKVAILARGVRNLRLINNDLSYNWKPRLYSIVEHESLVDWLSYHHNEKDEWLRYGGAMYLRDVHKGEIRGNTVTQGMNALLMTSSDSLLVLNNDFSFNSGLGMGLYRSSHNRIMHNRVDFNVRGYSEGFYRRGQDSAGILIYERSDSNVVAFNSVTHGGDGLFLWAGQTTMDSGSGGANDNLFANNDFSWAPTNGMEATFSRNVFVRNRIVGSDHGLWGGYSFNSVVRDNVFERNRVGIAIEHGQDNAIVRNRFDHDSTDIYLWANPIEPGDWGYPKHRDTRSRDYRIDSNVVSDSRVAFRVGNTLNLHLAGNAISTDSIFVLAGDTSGFAMDSALLDYPFPPDSSYPVQPLADGIKALPSEYAIWPRGSIIVDEWGPFDWKSPKLWPVDSSLSTPLRLRVLTPVGIGAWRVLKIRGAAISRRRGADGDTVVITPDSGVVEDWDITMEYRGRPTRSPAGVKRGENAPYVFGYSRFDPKLSWDVKVLAWTDSTHPLKAPAEFAALLRGERDTALVRLTTGRLSYIWYRPKVAGWPLERAAVVATSDVDLPHGAYTLRTISDDGVRVFIDDSLALENWSVHESEVNEVSLPSGKHRLRVEYFQNDGWTELRVEVLKREWGVGSRE